jgi:hypothetical protein
VAIINLIAESFSLEVSKTGPLRGHHITHPCSTQAMRRIMKQGPTQIVLCDNLHIQRYRLFRGLAGLGKSSTRWFFGFRLDLVINQIGEILRMKLSSHCHSTGRHRRISAHAPKTKRPSYHTNKHQ